MNRFISPLSPLLPSSPSASSRLPRLVLRLICSHSLHCIDTMQLYIYDDISPLTSDKNNKTSVPLQS